MTNLNANTINALDDYISHKEPGFAVLVAGPWGVGKTHLIKAFAKTIEGDEPPLIVSLFGVTSADDSTAFANMLARLEALEYTEPGVILHVLAVWLKAPKMGLVSDSVNVIEKECRAYIDAIAKSGALPASNGTSSGYGFERRSYSGLRYPHNDEPRGEAFQLLYDHMKTTQDRLLRDTFPDICKEILNLMQTDVQQFNTLLCGDSSSVNLYHRLPVLAEMKIENFIAQLANLSVEDQVTVYQTLKQRYDIWWEELLPEKPWLCDLVKAMEARAKTLSGVAAWQTRFNLQAYLNPIIDALEA